MGITSFGQTVLLTEGWENTSPYTDIPPLGWTIELLGNFIITYYTTTGTYPTVLPVEGSRLLDFKSHTNVVGASNRLRRTMSLSTIGYTNLTVDFQWYTDDGYPGCTNEGVTIQWSTDGVNWNSAGSLWPRYSPTNQWVLNSQALPPAASGQPALWIGFLFLGQNGNDCHMDIIHFTGTPAPGLPTVTTNAATSLLSNSATLNGTVNANGDSTTVSFNYGLTTSYGNTVTGIPSPVGGTINTSVSANITGLQCGTLYHFRAKGVNSSGTAYGNDMTFTTPSTVPIATTNAASGISMTGATLNGTVNPECSSSDVVFNWGLTTAYGNTIPGIPSPVNGNTSIPVSANISGLTSNQTYHYQVCATNANGTTCGTDVSFTTQCPGAGPAGPISGPIQVCQGQCGYVYSVAPITNASGYVWTLPAGASITAGANTNTITVCFANNAVSGSIFVYGTSVCGNGSSSQLSIAINPLPAPTINGPVSCCISSTGNVYTTQAGMTNYIWLVSAGGVITSGGTTSSNTITITWITVGAQTVSVNYTNANGCTATAPTVYNVTISNLPVPMISGPVSVCAGTTGNVYSTQPGMTNYAWSVSPGGTVTAGGSPTSNTITITWNSAGTQFVEVNYINSNGCTAPIPTTYYVTVNPLPTPTITGSNNLCAGSTGNVYITQAGMTNYIWSVSAGGTIMAGGTSADNTVTVDWNVAGAQFVSVNYTNTYGCSVASPVVYPVAVNNVPVPTISGQTSMCVNSGFYQYTTEAGMLNYLWTVSPGGVINYGLGTNQIQVSWIVPGSQSVNVNYTNSSGCTAINPTNLIILVNNIPDPTGIISGTPVVCSGTTGVNYSVAPVPGAITYVWNLPAGAIIGDGAGTYNITVNFTVDAVSGNITVYGNNLCGNGPVSPNFNLTVNTTPPAPVITNTGNILQSDASDGNQWYLFGSPIPGATGQTYISTSDGEYWDIVTLNGCSSLESNHILFYVGINAIESNNISIFPVPNDGQFTLSMTSPSKRLFTISVYNNLGIKIIEDEDIEVTGTVNHKIDLRPIQNGIYSVLIHNSVGQFVRKIVVYK
jgi:hypothetical protein